MFNIKTSFIVLVNFKYKFENIFNGYKNIFCVLKIYIRKKICNMFYFHLFVLNLSFIFGVRQFQCKSAPTLRPTKKTKKKFLFIMCFYF